MGDYDKNPEEGIKCTIDELIDYCQNLPSKWLPTDKNVEFKYKTGMTIDDIQGYVRDLRKEYYYEELDDLTPGHSGKMYVFKRLIQEHYWCYIKVKVNRTSRNELVLIVSFHDDERTKF